MSDNRVERLETRIRELEATVHGLTEELVDTKDRLERLESDSNADTENERTDRVPQATDEPDRESDVGDSLAAQPPDDTEATGNENADSTRQEDESSADPIDGIIVA